MKHCFVYSFLKLEMTFWCIGYMSCVIFRGQKFHYIKIQNYSNYVFFSNPKALKGQVILEEIFHIKNQLFIYTLICNWPRDVFLLKSLGIYDWYTIKSYILHSKLALPHNRRFSLSLIVLYLPQWTWYLAFSSKISLFHHS